MAPSGGEPVQITRDGGYNPFDSEDGQTIYYAKTNASPSPLWTVPAEGGRETEVLDSVCPGSFAVTRNGVYFVSRPRLQYFSFSTGISKPILTIEKLSDLGLTVPPDGHWLLYTQFDQGGSNLMRVENFR